MPGELKMNPKRPTDYWISRWDRMQEFYIPDRKTRFETLLSIVRARNQEPQNILDLGCGTGTIMLGCLSAFPAVRVVGVDYDPTLLSLAGERLKDFSSRVVLIHEDVRRKGWADGLV
ncbi:MAG TPA: class I SAM-dependent methyltransferase, partial [bacterium]